MTTISKDQRKIQDSLWKQELCRVGAPVFHMNDIWKISGIGGGFILGGMLEIVMYRSGTRLSKVVHVNDIEFVGDPIYATLNEVRNHLYESNLSISSIEEYCSNLAKACLPPDEERVCVALYSVARDIFKPHTGKVIFDREDYCFKFLKAHGHETESITMVRFQGHPNVQDSIRLTILTGGIPIGVYDMIYRFYMGISKHSLKGE